jgi:hypothetical protein
MKKKILLTVALAALMLNACGGGGGGGGKGSDGLVNNYNVNLKDLDLSVGQLSPGFSSDITAYNVEVASDVSSVEIVPETLIRRRKSQ